MSRENQFNPYEYNAGTTVAVHSNNKIIVASDTRLNSEYNFYTRKHSKIYKITDSFSLLGAGFDADLKELCVQLKFSIENYIQLHNKDISLEALSHVLMNILYKKRFFPYYSFVCLIGKEIVSFDCVGSYEKTKGRVYGTGQEIVQPLLDTLKNNQTEDIKEMIYQAFVSAAEIDVKTGDFVEILEFEGGKLISNDLKDLRKD